MENADLRPKLRFLEQFHGFVCLFRWNGYRPDSAAMDSALNVMLNKKFVYSVSQPLRIASLGPEARDYFVFKVGRHLIHSLYDTTRVKFKH